MSPAALDAEKEATEAHPKSTAKPVLDKQAIMGLIKTDTITEANKLPCREAPHLIYLPKTCLFVRNDGNWRG